MKYTRKWEDESAYAKQTIQNRNPRPEDFPELGSKGERRNKSVSQRDDREEKENKLSRQNYQSGADDDNRNYPSSRRRSLNRELQMSDRRDSDRRDTDRHDSDRRDSPRSHRQQDRYPSMKLFFFDRFSLENLKKKNSVFHVYLINFDLIQAEVTKAIWMIDERTVIKVIKVDRDVNLKTKIVIKTMIMMVDVRIAQCIIEIIAVIIPNHETNHIIINNNNTITSISINSNIMTMNMLNRSVLQTPNSIITQIVSPIWNIPMWDRICHRYKIVIMAYPQWVKNNKW